MKEWKLPSYKVFRVDSDYTESPSVRVSQYSLTCGVAFKIYWLEGTIPPTAETQDDSNGT